MRATPAAPQDHTVSIETGNQGMTHAPSSPSAQACDREHTLLQRVDIAITRDIHAGAPMKRSAAENGGLKDPADIGEDVAHKRARPAAKARVAGCGSYISVMGDTFRAERLTCDTPKTARERYCAAKEGARIISFDVRIGVPEISGGIAVLPSDEMREGIAPELASISAVEGRNVPCHAPELPSTICHPIYAQVQPAIALEMDAKERVAQVESGGLEKFPARTRDGVAEKDTVTGSSTGVELSKEARVSIVRDMHWERPTNALAALHASHSSVKLSRVLPSDLLVTPAESRSSVESTQAVLSALLSNDLPQHAISMVHDLLSSVSVMEGKYPPLDAPSRSGPHSSHTPICATAIASSQTSSRRNAMPANGDGTRGERLCASLLTAMDPGGPENTTQLTSPLREDDTRTLQASAGCDGHGSVLESPACELTADKAKTEPKVHHGINCTSMDSGVITLEASASLGGISPALTLRLSTPHSRIHPPPPPPSVFCLAKFYSGIFALVSAIIRTTSILYLGRTLVGERMPYRGWAREGIGTRA
jgi:hypothetical protein